MSQECQKVIPIASESQVKQRQMRDLGQRLTTLPPLSLYVHVPWCIKKCPYCDFNSHEAPASLPEADYLAALTQDIEQALPLIWGRQIHTVFIGGGTPSLMSEGAVDQLLAIIRSRLALWPDAEITLEANPGAAEAHRFKAYAKSGINRLSLGIQSFDDQKLQRLGRAHDAKQARDAIAMACDAVARVNLDLMYGLPDQTLAQCQADLAQAVAFGTEHLSLYQLTLEPQTVFAKYPPALPHESVIDDMEQAIEQQVVQAGWQRYEVSAYAKPGAQCRHNMNYWTFGDYLGVGPGAHSKLSFPERIIRQARTRNPQQWMHAAAGSDDSHISEQRELTNEDLPFEFFLNALRLQQGVPIALLHDHTGISLAEAQPMIERALDKKLLTLHAGVIAPTPLGWRHLNELQTLFLR